MLQLLPPYEQGTTFLKGSCQRVKKHSDATRVRALELLGKTVSLFNDTIEIKEARDSNDIEAEIEEKIIALLSKEEAEQ